jgi:hypothetical protein
VVGAVAHDGENGAPCRVTSRFICCLYRIRTWIGTQKETERMVDDRDREGAREAAERQRDNAEILRRQE